MLPREILIRKHAVVHHLALFVELLDRLERFDGDVVYLKMYAQHQLSNQTLVPIVRLAHHRLIFQQLLSHVLNPPILIASHLPTDEPVMCPGYLLVRNAKVVRRVQVFAHIAVQLHDVEPRRIVFDDVAVSRANLNHLPNARPIRMLMWRYVQFLVIAMPEHLQLTRLVQRRVVRRFKQQPDGIKRTLLVHLIATVLANQRNQRTYMHLGDEIVLVSIDHIALRVAALILDRHLAVRTPRISVPCTPHIPVTRPCHLAAFLVYPYLAHLAVADMMRSAVAVGADEIQIAYYLPFLYALQDSEILVIVIRQLLYDDVPASTVRTYIALADLGTLVIGIALVAMTLGLTTPLRVTDRVEPLVTDLRFLIAYRLEQRYQRIDFLFVFRSRLHNQNSDS